MDFHRRYVQSSLFAALTIAGLLAASVASGAPEGWVKNTLNAGPPTLPKSVIDFCLAEKSISHAECLAQTGWPPGMEELPQRQPPQCNMDSCNDIPPEKWEMFKEPFEEQDVHIQYATWFNLNRISASDWRLRSESQLKLINLQNTIDYLLRVSLPVPDCENETKVVSRSDTASGDTYTYKAVIRSDIRSCQKVPCFPDITKQCDMINDIGTLTNAVTVQVRAYIDGDKLKVNATNTFHQGSLQPQMKLLFDLEKVFNFATGHLFRSGNQRKYDDFMKLALQQAVEKSGEKLSRRITVAGGKAFNYRAEYTRMEMTPTGAVLKVGMSATIPDSVVCEVRAALNEMNGFKCTAPVTRGR